MREPSVVSMDITRLSTELPPDPYRFHTDAETKFINREADYYGIQKVGKGEQLCPGCSGAGRRNVSTTTTDKRGSTKIVIVSEDCGSCNGKGFV